jgi:glycosyltransferase involved in cell wall biosynthesis
MPLSSSSAVRLARIVTCFRQWSFIRGWIDDDRLFPPWIQWIVVNDCPDDLCPPDLHERLVQRGVNILSPVANLGRCNARNFGASQAVAEWIENIDGDDRPLPIALEALDHAGPADLLLFPMLQFQEGEEPPTEASAVELPPDAESYWGFLMPSLRPIDHRLTCTMWRRAKFLELHGYNERFDGNEDLHLMWKAAQAGIVVARWTYPKQAYRIHARVDIREKPEYFESLRFYQWLRTRCTPEQQRPLDLLIGRQVLAIARLFIRDAWRRRREVFAFLRAKMTGEFFRLYR